MLVTGPWGIVYEVTGQEVRCPQLKTTLTYHTVRRLDGQPCEDVEDLEALGHMLHERDVDVFVLWPRAGVHPGDTPSGPALLVVPEYLEVPEGAKIAFVHDYATGETIARVHGVS